MSLPHTFRVGRSGAGGPDLVDTYNFAMIGGGGHQGQDGPQTIGGHGGAFSFSAADVDGADIATWYYVVGVGGGAGGLATSSGPAPLTYGGGGRSPVPKTTGGWGGGFTGLFTNNVATSPNPSLQGSAIAVVGGGGGGSWGDAGGSGGSCSQNGGNGADTTQQSGRGGTLSAGGSGGPGGSSGGVMTGASNPGSDYYSSSGGGGYYGGGSMNQNDGAGGAGSGGGSGFFNPACWSGCTVTNDFNSTRRVNGPSSGAGGFPGNFQDSCINAGSGTTPGYFRTPGGSTWPWANSAGNAGVQPGGPAGHPYGRCGAPGFLRIHKNSDPTSTACFNSTETGNGFLNGGSNCAGPLAPFFA